MAFKKSRQNSNFFIDGQRNVKSYKTSLNKNHKRPPPKYKFSRAAENFLPYLLRLSLWERWTDSFSGSTIYIVTDTSFIYVTVIIYIIAPK